MIKAVHVNDADNCVTLADSAFGGDNVCFPEGGAERTVTAREDIPQWHKMAVTAIEKGGSIYKYGSIIGIASENIKSGDCIHIHNMRSPGGG